VEVGGGMIYLRIRLGISGVGPSVSAMKALGNW